MTFEYDPMSFLIENTHGFRLSNFLPSGSSMT